MEQYYLMEKEPAKCFGDAHLLGNGTLGASVFGGVPYETIGINCDTLWSGQESEKTTERTKKYLPYVRKLILEGKYQEATRWINDEMLGYWSESFLPLANLYVTIGHSGEQRSMKQRRILSNEVPYEAYQRVLFLEKAVECITYEQGGLSYKREYFASGKDQVMVLRISASGGKFDFSIGMDSPLRYEMRIDSCQIAVTGRAPERVESYSPQFMPLTVYKEEKESDCIRFGAAARVKETDGVVVEGELRLFIKDATYAVILMAAETNYAGYRRNRKKDSEMILENCGRRLGEAAEKSYEQLLADHINEYQNLYKRVDLYLGEGITDELTTSERLRRYQDIDDPAIAALALQYSRYLLISSSRPGSQPANLQGIWNMDICPPWASNYTLNINTEMNYWGAEILGLPECHEPLLDMTKELSESGKKAAETLYGCRGWVAHHNTDLWRMTSLSGESASWAWWPFGGIWLCQHLWEHYEYTKDLDFLKQDAYPIVQGAVEFLMDYMTRDDENRIITVPSTSPENSFFLPGVDAKRNLREGYTGYREERCACVCKASAMDLGMVRELLSIFMKMQDELQMGSIYRDEITEIFKCLYPFQVGKDGQLQEWEEDFAQCTPGISHMSHLYGVFPGNSINETDTPELFQAAHHSLTARIRHGACRCHWSASWAVNLFARYKEGTQCNQIFGSLAAELGANMLTRQGHQIDCIMGWGAGIAHMLLQSRDGCLDILPALPPSWRTGYVKGLCARGGYVVDIAWENAVLKEILVLSRKGGICRIRYNGEEILADTEVGETITANFINGTLTETRRAERGRI